VSPTSPAPPRVNSPILQSITNDQQQQQQQADSRDLLHRTLAAIGMSRLGDPDPVIRAQSFKPRLALTPSPSPSANLKQKQKALNLPPGVYITTIPGALTRASDGTFVRGIWGQRTSGQGIGARRIEGMPLVGAVKRNARLDGERAGPSETTNRSEMVMEERRRRNDRESGDGSECDDCCDECCDGLIDWFCCLRKDRE
jgi:hypothetical protein